MFSLARMIVRNKVGAAAVLAIGVFILTPGEQEPEGPSNPWAKRETPAVTVAQQDEGGFIDDIMTEATEFLDETGMNPVEKADETVKAFDDTASAYSRANRN